VLPLGVDAVYQMRQASMPQAISKVISDADKLCLMEGSVYFESGGW
jgi:hypothetical protein